MHDSVEQFEHLGHKVAIYYDDSGASNPRDYCNVGTIVGFTSSRYNFGDDGEQIDPSDLTLDCTACEDGVITFPIMGEYVERGECRTCDGFGNIYVRTFEQMTEWIKTHYDVVGDVLPINRYDHGSVTYSIGTAGGWDSSDAGVIFATTESVEATGVPQTQIPEALRIEVEEYSRWANGEVYGYVISDRNDDEVDSCWGFVGLEYAIEEAKAATPDEQPEVLVSLRVTIDTLRAIVEALDTVDYPDVADLKATLASVPQTQSVNTDTDTEETS